MSSQPALRRSPLQTILPMLLIFVLAAAAYITTMAPGILGGDAGELQFAPTVLSLTHPTGYPLQSLLNKLWVTILPLGTVAWRTNLLSALSAATGVTVTSALVLRSTGSLVAAVAAAVLLAFSPVYWGQAVLGDKYALNGLLTALLLAAAYRFYRRPEWASSWLLLGLVTGTCLAHHRSFLAFGPALAVFVLVLGRMTPRKAVAWLVLAVGLLMPLLLYLYVPIASQRGLPPYQPRINSLHDFASFVQDAGYLGQVGLLPKIVTVQSYARTLAGNFGMPILVLGAIGVVVSLIRGRDRGWLIFLLGCFLLQAYLTQNYSVPRQFVFYIPAYVCLVVLLTTAVALSAVPASDMPVAPLARRKAQIRERAFIVTPVLLLVILGLLRVPSQWHVQRQEQAIEAPLDLFRQDLKAGGRADRLAASLRLAPARAMVSADWEQATPLWYAQQVDRACPDCIIRSQMENDLDRHAKQAAAEGRPLMVARTVNGAGDWSEPTSVGALVALDGRPNHAVPADLTPRDVTFDGQIRLLGYRWPLGMPEMRSGKVMPVSLVWQPVSPAQDYAISLRLLRDEETVWVEDLAAPVLGMQPFSKLEPGQVIEDYREIPIEPDARPGHYKLIVILYQSKDGTFRNAETVGTAGQKLGPTAEVLSFDLP